MTALTHYLFILFLLLIDIVVYKVQITQDFLLAYSKELSK